MGKLNFIGRMSTIVCLSAGITVGGMSLRMQRTL